MDWRISIRGIWDIQGRDKGKKRNTPPTVKWLMNYYE
jgi:hypothetical protein